MAYPTAFLIIPEKAKNETLKKIGFDKVNNKKTALQNMRFIRVLTNLKPHDVKRLMIYMNNCRESSPYVYKFDNGLNVTWQIIDKSCNAILSGCKNAKELQQFGEQYFQQLDELSGDNVRLINNAEYFYYNYETNYTSVDEIRSALKSQGADNIYSIAPNEISAKVDGNNVKYTKNQENKTFSLEVEQKISIVNIGIGEDTSSKKLLSSSPLQALKFQTNIKSDELKKILQDCGYMFYTGNSQTPLKTLNATLNWILQDGFYVAEFSGPNVAAIKNEAEEIFKKMNITARRDLRNINEQTTVIYTYNTNYTDKGILLNTLAEHGASNLTEEGDKVSCNLFGMNMVYTKSETGAYSLDITKVSDVDECMGVINDLNGEYGLNIQEMTYNKIKERLERENMRLEDETVLDDNSIVLTIDVG